MMFGVFVLCQVLLQTDAFSGSPWQKIPLMHFYPPGVSFVGSRYKRQLPIGNIDPPHQNNSIWHSIESIPIQTRIDIIDSLLSMHQQDQLQQKIRGQNDPVLVSYMKNLDTWTSIDPGVYRLLVRYATGSLSVVSETHLISASAIADHIHSQFPNGELNYVTPEYLLDWYTFIGGSVGRLQCPPNPIIRRIIEKNGLKIYGDQRIIVKLALQPFKVMLRIRRNRLLSTGYEVLA